MKELGSFIQDCKCNLIGSPCLSKWVIYFSKFIASACIKFAWVVAIKCDRWVPRELDQAEFKITNRQVLKLKHYLNIHDATQKVLRPLHIRTHPHMWHAKAKNEQILETQNHIHLYNVRIRMMNTNFYTQLFEDT